MTREELEHIIRAAADITNQYEFVIVGSQSILGTRARPERVFTVSMEAGIYPLAAPELANDIGGAIGEGSQFHETYGYYAQGVGPDTAILPNDWQERVCRVQNGNTNDRVGYCIGVLALFLAKAVAGRDKDREFCKALIEHHYVTVPDVLALIGRMPLDGGEQRKLRSTVRRWARAVEDEGSERPVD